MSIAASKTCNKCRATTFDTFAEVCPSCGEPDPALRYMKATADELTQLRSKVAELEQDRDERTKTFNDFYDTLHKYWPGTVNELLEAWQKQNQQLATSQLEVKRLREALEHAYKARRALCRHSDFDSDSSDPDTWDTNCQLYGAALAAHTDTAALDAYVAEKVKEALEESVAMCQEEKVDAAATGTSDDAAYNLAIDHCCTAIRHVQAALNQQKEGE